MTAGFGSLYYTDCVPGQGLQGGAGFQFQAATPGVASEAMTAVQRGALYEPPTAWMREQRPVGDYPRSLAHVSNGELYATAAGRYLGREANGSREGNQFTHAVVTRHEQDYGAHRPAQLWGASWWVAEPAPGTDAPGLPALPAPGPLDTETVQQRLRAADGGGGTLVALLSALHHLADPERRRSVVLVTEDPERAACWLAGATLLLPRRAALAIGFKIFVADPQRGQHDVIGLHPEWAGRWRSVDRGSGLAVFDLDTMRHTEIEETEAARFWAPRFLDDDAFDIVDAVELAGQFTDGAPAAGPSDRLVALVAAAGRPLQGPAEVEAAATWLRTSAASATELVRDTVLEAVLETCPDAGVLRTLVAASSSKDWGATAERLRAGLLTREVAEVAAASTGLAALAAIRGLEPLGASGRTPRPGVTEIEHAVRRLDVDRIPALCALADRHRLELSAGWADGATLDRAARWWVTRPEPEFAHGGWPAPAELLDQVRDVLRSGLAGPDPAGRERAHAAIHRAWGRVLWHPGADLADPLDRALAGYAFGRATGAQRWAVLDQVLDAVAADGGPDPAARAWSVLFARTPASGDVRVVLDGLYRRRLAPSAVVVGAAHEVVERAAEPGPDELQIVDLLIEMEVPLHGLAGRIEDQRRDVWRIERDLTARKLRLRLPAMAGVLETTPLAILRAHAGSLAEALEAATTTHAFGLVGGCRRETLGPVYKALESRLPRPGSTPTDAQCRTAAFVFLLTGGDARSTQQAADFRILRGHLADAVRGLPAGELARIERAHETRLGKPWSEWVREQQSGKLRRLARRLAGKSSSREG
ncbi:GTPase-associated protein 1-related protein [Pseudonocardia sp. ICBG1034]|uniref:GTPase-associated protein 1-related protein n=1 Tax=Pseudonocardia sp. ICBG1034 TaxID=2844381 RepID=UPI001CCA75DC|nr:GTPase-associated protein 1-related protein [Pseudonocardia sp. ICBG1034]